MPGRDADKGGAIPRWRNRLVQAAGRAAGRMELDPDSALQAAQHNLEWALRRKGPDPQFAVNARVEVAEQLENRGRFEEASVLRAEISDQLRRHLGPDEPGTLTAEAFEGLDLDRLGRSSEALPLFEHVLDGRIKTLGPNNELTLLAMEWLGCTQRNLGNLDESRRVLEDAVRRYALIGAGESDDCNKTTSHLATTLFELEQFHEACVLQRQIVDVRTRTLGQDDPATLGSLRNLAVTLWWLGEVEEARVIALSVLGQIQRLYGHDDPRTQQARELINDLGETADPDSLEA
jgi:eukaryotic-like serine/threonine-protein kinase